MAPGAHNGAGDARSGGPFAPPAPPAPPLTRRPPALARPPARDPCGRGKAVVPAKCTARWAGEAPTTILE
jgi:hypothetical protein